MNQGAKTFDATTLRDLTSRDRSVLNIGFTQTSKVLFTVPVQYEMTQDYTEYLAINVLNEQQLVSAQSPANA